MALMADVSWASRSSMALPVAVVQAPSKNGSELDSEKLPSPNQMVDLYQDQLLREEATGQR